MIKQLTVDPFHQRHLVFQEKDSVFTNAANQKIQGKS